MGRTWRSLLYSALAFWEWELGIGNWNGWRNYVDILISQCIDSTTKHFMFTNINEIASDLVTDGEFNPSGVCRFSRQD